MSHAGGVRSAAALVAVLALAAAAFGAERITFGVQVAPESASYDEVLRTAKVVEDAGYDHFWLNDHFLPSRTPDGPNLESWTLLSALAADTERIRLGILVTGNTYRHPAVLAKMATTVDHVSRGRLNFGIGAAWQEPEHTAYGIPFYTPKERSARLGESLEVITRLWRDDHPSFTGKYYTLVAAPFAPKPVQRPHPPIVVGGQGKQWIMPLVARYADEWNAPVGLTPAEVGERIAGLRAECERIGRTPCVRAVSVFLPLANITNVPLAGPATRLGAKLLYDAKAGASVLAGSADAIAARIREYVDVGVTSIVVTTRPAIDHDLMRRFAAEVAPLVRAAPASAP